VKGLAFLTTAAVGVSQAERAADVVAVNTLEGDFVYTRASQLAFLLATTDPGWNEGWRETACPVSSACDRQTEEGNDGGRMVRLSFVERKHARRELFTFETDGERLLHVYTAIRRSIFDLLSSLSIFVIASGVTVGLAFIIFYDRSSDGFDAV
jgi:hypothetical protein